MAKLKFKETQRYRHWEVIALLAILSLGTAIRLIVTLLSDHPKNEDGLLLGAFLLGSLLIALFYFLRLKLEVKVNRKGIKYSIYPWLSRKQKIKWEDVKSFELVDLPEPAALSGWSIQYGVLTHGCDMGNHRGISLGLRNGERYFLSIDDLEELEDILEKLFEEE